MYFAITHLTTFTYDAPIADSVMELRMQPRSDRLQRCIQFELKISPTARPQQLKDYLGNFIQTFDIPGRHERLAIKVESIVETKLRAPIPRALPDNEWDALEDAIDDRDTYDMLMPSHFAKPTEALLALRDEIGVDRSKDPLTTLLAMNTAIFEKFAYIQNVTEADSPIDIALEKRLGVCQDFAHIMISLAREVGIPCRYVSGYLFHRRESAGPRSAVDASHAWVEAYLPTLGWVGFDPTNNLICGQQHIRVAIGRDYADVPPSKGVFVGDAASELRVAVKVSELDEIPVDQQRHAPEIQMPTYELMSQQQQQQQ
ncbi:MAG: transglutaminase family protein [Chloroflexota bacterium]